MAIKMMVERFWYMDSIIKSLLDTDLYKFSMGAAVFQNYPRSDVTYGFFDRSGVEWPLGFGTELVFQIGKLSELRFAQDEIEFLAKKCPYLPRTYLEWLSGYRFDPSEIEVVIAPDNNWKLYIKGPWYRTILWEVPLLAIISELYFKMAAPDVSLSTGLMHYKAERIARTQLFVGELGTRRRFSHEAQETLLRVFRAKAGSSFIGTSNVHFAKELGLRPIGTQAHEWFMFHAAKYGFKMANQAALEKWVEMYQGDLGIALSDTFTTDVFFRSFGKKFAKLFDGVRHDSGSPFEFAEKTIAYYKSLGIDPASKTIIFSDGLDLEKALRIRSFCADRIKASFGIGTNLTNDVGIDPLNIVIKMTHADPDSSGDMVGTVKLSDANGKHTGHPRDVELCQRILGI